MEDTLSKVKGVKELSAKAIRRLYNYQTGRENLVLTGREYIDKHLGGLLPGDCVTIFAPSGVGKTEEFFKIFKNFLDVDINPNAKNYVSLEFNLEMQYFNLFLRDASKKFRKKKTDILSKEFTEEEKALVREYHESLSDDRRFIVEESVTTKEMFDIMDSFFKKNKDKEAILVGIDHVGLVLQSEKGEDSLEKITTSINILKKRYNNVYFVLLTQINRSYYATESRERSNNNVPTTSMIYGASHFEYLSSYVIAIVNPFKTFGIREYMKVKPDRHKNLEDFETEMDKKGFISYDAIGNLFYHILKVRDSDYIFDNLHIEKMDLSDSQIEMMRKSVEETKEEIEVPIFGTLPTFPANFEDDNPF